jgi:hypothetical protein
LHLNLGKTWGFFKNYYPLSVSNAWLAYCWLAQYLSLFISLALFFVCLFVCLFVLYFFHFLYLLWFPSTLIFHSRYHHCYYYKLDNTELHTVQGQY